jgi:MerR family transcriptional regulator, light-induced transcriptional regulator
MRQGLAPFVCHVLAPLNVQVGDAWIRGQIEVFEEHMYTESVNIVLRNAIHQSSVPDTAAHPRVLLTTFPLEPHGLGLLMVQAMLVLEDCKCISLGVQTPLMDIVLAATAHHADIVALSFTASLNPNYVSNGLEELRQKLPRSIEIWAGGHCPAIHRKAIDGVRVMTDLHSISSAVKHWRITHPALGHAAVL